MAKTLVVGDIHLKAYDILPQVDEILADDENISRVVFAGDLCDEWGVDVEHGSHRRREHAGRRRWRCQRC